MTEILLVDDDRLSLAVLSEGLRKLGYTVRTAESGEEAITICTIEPPDLAILDISMPGLSGIETARELRNRMRVPYLFLSAYSEKDIVVNAAKEGALGYLVKPMDVAQVAPTIEAALARATELRSLQDSESSLNRALAAGRDSSMAVGLIMERYRLSRKIAFEVLRFHARSQRRKIEDVAAEMVAAAEGLNLPPEVLARAQDTKSSN